MCIFDLLFFCCNLCVALLDTGKVDLTMNVVERKSGGGISGGGGISSGYVKCYIYFVTILKCLSIVDLCCIPVSIYLFVLSMQNNQWAFSWTNWEVIEFHWDVS